MLSRSAYRPDIDGLRCVAVVAVIIFHAFPALLPGGFVGVDIFFVISGYLISGNIFDRINENRFSFLDFYEHRIRRILPALIAVLLVVLIAGWFLLLDDEYTQLGEHITASAIFGSNFLLWQEAGYFDNASATKPLLHLWSLGVEEQFYIVWPPILLLARKLRLNWWLVLTSILVASFAANIYYRYTDSVFDFYSPTTRFWELAIGAIIALAEREFVWIKRFQGLPIGLLGLALIVSSCAFLREGMHFPGYWAVGPVLGSALLIVSAAPILSNRLFVGIGLISYPLYLWHWPILSFIRIVFGNAGSHSVRLAAVAISVALAIATWWLIERPLRFGPNKHIKSGALAAGLVLTGLAGLLAFHTDGFEPIRSTLVRGLIVQDLSWKAGTPGCMEKYPYDDTVAFWFCAESRDAPPTTLLLGNSYANDLLPGLTEQIPQQNFLNVGACYPLDGGVYWQISGMMDHHPCAGSNWGKSQSFIRNLIKAKPTIKTAILMAEWPDFQPDGSSPHFGRFVDPNDPDATSLEGFIRGLGARIDFLKAHNVQPILVLPRPRFTYDVKTCLSRPMMSPINTCIADRKTFEAAPLRSAFLALAAAKDIHYFDPLPAFCKGDVCDLKPQGRLLVRDDTSHLSLLGSRVFAKAFIAWARANDRQLIDAGS